MINYPKAFSNDNVFTALSGQTNGGTNQPNSVVSALPQQGQLPLNMGNPQQGIPYNRFGMGANGGQSGGQQQTPMPQMPQTGSGLPGMFTDILGSLPGIMKAMGQYTPQNQQGLQRLNSSPLGAALQGFSSRFGQHA